MLKIYTAQYKYSGPYRLDITVKGNDPVGSTFAPTQAMVKAYYKTGDEKAYIEAYHTMMIASYLNDTVVWNNLLKHSHIVLVCFCAPEDFCHRTLLAGYLEKLGAEYQGEIHLVDMNYILPKQPIQVEQAPITSFREKYGFLSNFYKMPIACGGITYKSNEHLFQSRKFGEDKWAYMSKCLKPKQEGKKADLSNGWFEANKVEIMLTGLRLKFANPVLKEKLLATEERELVEGNHWHDNIWGDCTCSKCANTPGQNILGKLLMQVRKELSPIEQTETIPKQYYYCHHESDCIWASTDPDEAVNVVEEIDKELFDKLKAKGYHVGG